MYLAIPIVEYVSCKTCKSPDTLLTKDNRLFFMTCESCGSTRSVSAIKSGFQVSHFLSRLHHNHCDTPHTSLLITHETPGSNWKEESGRETLICCFTFFYCFHRLSLPCHCASFFLRLGIAWWRCSCLASGGLGFGFRLALSAIYFSQFEHSFATKS